MTGKVVKVPIPSTAKGKYVEAFKRLAEEARKKREASAPRN